MENFDLEKLERKNIYKTPEYLFENVQHGVLDEINAFDLEKLERKNFYTVPENLFENIQEHVLHEIKPQKKAPMISLQWGYGIAASLALIFGAICLYQVNSGSLGIEDHKIHYAQNNTTSKQDSEIAYETLASDLTSSENINQNNETTMNTRPVVSHVVNNNTGVENKKIIKATREINMNEYLESLDNSEIAELANNSGQDVYLDLYN